MRGPCACPRRRVMHLPHKTRTIRIATRDRHKSPALLHVRPLSLQDETAFPVMARFGCQNSLDAQDLSTLMFSEDTNGREQV